MDDTPRLAVAQLLARARMLKREHNAHAILIDCLRQPFIVQFDSGLSRIAGYEIVKIIGPIQSTVSVGRKGDPLRVSDFIGGGFGRLMLGLPPAEFVSGLGFVPAPGGGRMPNGTETTVG